MSDVPVFEPEDQPSPQRRGVTVITPHGRAVSFGISRARTEKLLKTLAQRKDQELTATMLEQKAARIKARADSNPPAT